MFHRFRPSLPLQTCKSWLTPLAKSFVDCCRCGDPNVVKIANWHARLNVIALLIFAASFYLRTTNGSAAGEWELRHCHWSVRFRSHPYLNFRLLARRDGFQHGVAVDKRPQTGTKLFVP